MTPHCTLFYTLSKEVTSVPQLNLVMLLCPYTSENNLHFYRWYMTPSGEDCILARAFLHPLLVKFVSSVDLISILWQNLGSKLSLKNIIALGEYDIDRAALLKKMRSSLVFQQTRPCAVGGEWKQKSVMLRRKVDEESKFVKRINRSLEQ